VKLAKPDFIGKQGLLAQLKRGHRKLFVSMTVDCDIAAAHSGDPIFCGDRQVGTVTSGGYGFRVNKNIAYAFVDPDQSVVGTALSLGILGERYDVTVVDPVLYDPENNLVRS
jgi:dimethylglycine dehydrogenase